MLLKKVLSLSINKGATTLLSLLKSQFIKTLGKSAQIKASHLLIELGFEKLEDKFDSIYMHALVQFAIDTEHLQLFKTDPIVKVLAHEEVIKALHNEFYNEKKKRVSNRITCSTPHLSR